MRLSFNDYLLLRSIATSLSKRMELLKKGVDPTTPPTVETLYANGERPKSEAEIKNVSESVQNKKNILWRAHPLSTISQEDIIPQLPKLVELPPSIAILSAEKISLVLIDDSGDRDIPLVELESKNITAEVTETQGKIGCTIVCCLFNQNLSLWEPFVEPFNFHCSGLREKTGYSITVNPRNRLNINLTQNLVQLQKNILPRLQKLFSEKSLENHNFDMIRKKFRPYTLQNRTGMPVAFSTSGAQGGGLDFFFEIFCFFFRSFSIF